MTVREVIVEVAGETFDIIEVIGLADSDVVKVVSVGVSVVVSFVVIDFVIVVVVVVVVVVVEVVVLVELVKVLSELDGYTSVS